jgi:hypothetical protein
MEELRAPNGAASQPEADVRGDDLTWNNVGHGDAPRRGQRVCRLCCTHIFKLMLTARVDEDCGYRLSRDQHVRVFARSDRLFL